MFKNMREVCKKFLKSESGETVNWLVVIAIGVILAVVVWQNLGEGVRSASESMKDALTGE